MQQQVLHAMLATCQPTRFLPISISMKTTAYFRDVVRQKHPGIAEAWIMRVLADPLEERSQADGRIALWGLVPEAQNRALRVINLEVRVTVHNAFVDRGFLRARLRSQPSPPAAPPAP